MSIIRFLVTIFKNSLRTILRTIRDIDGLFNYMTQLPFKSKYQIGGTCKKRGVCCQRIAIYLSSSFWQYPLLKTLVIHWYQFVYNFSFIEDDSEHRVILFKCNYLKDQKCQIYWKRPLICRTYPKPRFFSKPEFLPGCGYHLARTKKKAP